MKKLTFILVVILAVSSYSQINKSYFGVIGSLTLPLDEFKNDNYFNQEGLALSGFSGGVQYTLPLFNKYVAFLFESSVIVNFFNIEGGEDDVVLRIMFDPEGGNYFNIPILSGIKFTIPISSTLKLHASGQAGFNILKESELSSNETTFGRGKVVIDFDPDVTFAWGIGVGIAFLDRFNVGVKFLYLGKPEFDYDACFRDPQWNFGGEREFKVHVFQFVLGYDF